MLFDVAKFMSTLCVLFYDRKLYEEENPKEKNKSKTTRRDRLNLSNRRDAPAMELPSDELLKWRNAVEAATSASQLAVCLSQLECCICWEKSRSVGVSGGW